MKEELLIDIFQEIAFAYENLTYKEKSAKERLIETAYNLGRINGLLSKHKEYTE